MAQLENLVATITQPVGQEGAAYAITLPDGESVVIGDAEDDYWAIANIIDNRFGS